MKFGTTDDKFLVGQAVGAAAYGAHAFFAPSHFQDTHGTDKAGRNDTNTRWLGAVLFMTAGVSAAAAGDADGPHKKRVLKAAGASWLAAGACNAAFAKTGHEKRNLAIAKAVGNAAVGVACLCQAFCKDKAPAAPAKAAAAPAAVKK